MLYYDVGFFNLYEPRSQSVLAYFWLFLWHDYNLSLNSSVK